MMPPDAQGYNFKVECINDSGDVHVSVDGADGLFWSRVKDLRADIKILEQAAAALACHQDV